jgi:formylglycine-generating enzyme required for sulfatase activity
VSEWVADWYAESFPRADTRNPQGPQNGTTKVVRGGDRFDSPDRIAVTRRYFASPDHRSETIGFRCAR